MEALLPNDRKLLLKRYMGFLIIRSFLVKFLDHQDQDCQKLHQSNMMEPDAAIILCRIQQSPRAFHICSYKFSASQN